MLCLGQLHGENRIGRENGTGYEPVEFIHFRVHRCEWTRRAFVLPVIRTGGTLKDKCKWRF